MCARCRPCRPHARCGRRCKSTSNMCMRSHDGLGVDGLGVEGPGVDRLGVDGLGVDGQNTGCCAACRLSQLCQHCRLRQLFRPAALQYSFEKPESHDKLQQVPHGGPGGNGRRKWTWEMDVGNGRGKWTWEMDGENGRGRWTGETDGGNAKTDRGKDMSQRVDLDVWTPFQ
eukprot:364294-Chlamydomonas_euryale.AAC.7